MQIELRVSCLNWMLNESQTRKEVNSKMTGGGGSKGRSLSCYKLVAEQCYWWGRGGALVEKVKPLGCRWGAKTGTKVHLLEILERQQPYKAPTDPRPVYPKQFTAHTIW